MSLVSQLADAVVARVNSGAYDEEFTATRSFLPRLKLEEAQSLHVTVAPGPWRTEGLIARNRRPHEITIDIGVQERLDVATEAARIEALLDLVEALDQRLFNVNLTIDGGECRWQGHAIDAPYRPEHLDELNQFTSILRVTYAVYTKLS